MNAKIVRIDADTIQITITGLSEASPIIIPIEPPPGPVSSGPVLVEDTALITIQPTAHWRYLQPSILAAAMHIAEKIGPIWIIDASPENGDSAVPPSHYSHPQRTHDRGNAFDMKYPRIGGGSIENVELPPNDLVPELDIKRLLTAVLIFLRAVPDPYIVVQHNVYFALWEAAMKAGEDYQLVWDKVKNAGYHDDHIHFGLWPKGMAK
jgi:hypothetical protein